MDKNLDLNSIGIVYNSEIEGSKDFAACVSCCFFENGLTISKPNVFDIQNMPDDLTFVVSIGGDGTLLKCARYYSKLNVPVFGFNMGRLGYLSQALPSELDFVVQKIKNKDFRIEERLMLKSSTESVALNDMVVKKELNAR